MELTEGIMKPWISVVLKTESAACCDLMYIPVFPNRGPGDTLPFMFPSSNTSDQDHSWETLVCTNIYIYISDTQNIEIYDVDK